ncbi:unnamed protein product [Owenia fusiformis]|uniref:Uncharacterized protein n=1 Tax=Owenia fusiformis TaxID=6347 RepID=A0A8S4N828_OWEFU|nr:unnamed protein product [Owenia fusiformis]
MQAINMNYDARGILYMSDDVLLKVESLREFNMSEIWLSNYKYGEDERRDLFIASYIDQINGPKQCHTNNLTLPCNFTNRHIQPFIALKRQLLNVHTEILNKITLEIHDDKFFTNFLQSLEERSGGKKRFFKTIVDIYYLPKSYWEQFNRLAEVFLKHRVFMELAVPNILHGIEILNDHPVTLLEARNISRSQMIPILFRKKAWYAWHPFKLGTMAHGDKDTIQAYCSLFHGQWYRNPQFIK